MKRFTKQTNLIGMVTGALVLWALYQEQNIKEIPLKFNKDWTEDEVFQKLNDENYVSQYEQITQVGELWLPSNFNFIFKALNLFGEEQIFGSTYELFANLEDLNSKTWKADEKEIEEWRRFIDPNTDFFEEKAKFGFSIFYALTSFANINNVPLKPDY